MRWLAPTTPEEEVPRRDGAEDAEDTAAAADESTADPPCVLGPSVQEVAGVAPPFAVQDYVIRIEWQKRGYPHAHILVWTDDKPSQADAPDTNTAETLIDKYICTTSPNRWKQEELPVIEKLAEMVVHKHSAYCGRYTLGACRFGFPHREEPETRRRTAREQWGTRSKSAFAVKRDKDASMMGQYNPALLLKWRGSMDLQLISDAGSASKYILGYTLKAEEDVTTAKRVEQMIIDMTRKG